VTNLLTNAKNKIKKSSREYLCDFKGSPPRLLITDDLCKSHKGEHNTTVFASTLLHKKMKNTVNTHKVKKNQR